MPPPNHRLTETVESGCDCGMKNASFYWLHLKKIRDEAARSVAILTIKCGLDHGKE
jgi:hypothetical protein